ncbi:MAG: hypothetical protein K9M49_03210 [Candidatus Marinimicrobia bacterium]|nr:hypothetical protein [Candidatus Neomarinimicrobiota bacterium]MCF7851200.1 hypothetical protein [Candidatus Neomarinimicrobiota bacterium]MCF7904142.1 hypothetical protein [Candidatus Neomarinimicrobiota bacterium]
MRSIVKTIAFVLVLSQVYAGGLRVNITNGTTNSPGKAERVNIIDLASGMNQIASQSDVSGSVDFAEITPELQKQYLIQVFSENISYSRMITPPSDGSGWVEEVTVYAVSSQASGLVVGVPFFAIQAREDQLYIQKRLTIDNRSNPPQTFVGDPGIIQVHVPDDMVQMDFATFKSGTMPLQTKPVKTDAGHFLTNAIKPGLSEIDIAYYLPYPNSDVNISEQVHYDIDHFHVFTSPTSLHLHGDGLVRDPGGDQDGWAMYAADGVKAGTSLEFHISGAGFGQEQTQSSTGRIVVEHRMAQGTKLIMSLVLILSTIVALAYSLRREDEAMKQDSLKQLNDQKLKLLKEYSGLKTNADDKAELNRVLHQLYSVYKTLDRIA